LEILSMPDPLPSDIVARLRSDSTAALAASLILAGSFPDIVSWALRAFSRRDEPKASAPADAGSNSRRAPRPQPAVKSDKALLAVMQANPGASLADLIRLGRRPRTSTVLSLKRLEEAGLVEHPGKGVKSRFRAASAESGPKVCSSRDDGSSQRKMSVNPALDKDPNSIESQSTMLLGHDTRYGRDRSTNPPQDFDRYWVFCS
jgi:hypothetical protein